MDKFLDLLTQWEDRIEAALNVLGVSLIMVLMVMVCADVATRTLTGGSVRGLYELAEVVLVFAVFFAVPWTQRQKGHVVVDVALNQMPAKVRRAVETASLFAFMCVSALLFWASALEAVSSTQQLQTTAGVVPWPTWPARIAIAVSFFFLTVRIFLQLAQKMRGPTGAAAVAGSK